MRGLYKRGKYYWMSYSVNGKMHFESTKKTTIRDAEIVLADRKREARNGTIQEDKEIKDCKFVELVQEYLKWCKRQRSYKDKKLWIKQLVEVFGNLNVRDVNTRIIEQLQSKRLKYNKPSTVNRILATLKHMINKGVQWKMANDETLKQVRNVKLLEENNRRLRYLSLEECQRLIDCCSKHLKPIVILALNTGMRRGEILGLKWEQVDLRHGFILIDRTKNGERREIPINTSIEYLFKEIPHSIESEYVFAGKTGKPLTDIKKGFHTALRKAGIRDFRFHDLRHTFASQLAMQGIDLTTVKELLGHKSLTMTLRYSHLAPGHKRKAVMHFDNVLNMQLDKNLTFSTPDTPTTCHKSFNNKCALKESNLRPTD